VPEAGPSTPGHAGFTPQHVDSMVRRSRLAGIFSTVAIRYREWLPKELASQEFRQLQHYVAASESEALARAATYASQMRAIGPKSYQPALGLPPAEDPLFVLRDET
jgi:hypothetical protein